MNAFFSVHRIDIIISEKSGQGGVVWYVDIARYTERLGWVTYYLPTTATATATATAVEHPKICVSRL